MHFCPRQSDQPASAGDRLGVHSPDLRPDPSGGHAVSEQGLCSLVSKGAAALCPRVAGSLTLQGPMTLVESYLGCVLGFLSSGDSQRTFLYSWGFLGTDGGWNFLVLVAETVFFFLFLCSVDAFFLQSKICREFHQEESQRQEPPRGLICPRGD